MEFDRYVNDFTGEEKVILTLSVEEFNLIRFDMSMAIGHLVGKPVSLESFEDFIDASQTIA
jgi:hypothetical protein